jgi:hypothetical protein
LWAGGYLVWRFGADIEWSWADINRFSGDINRFGEDINRFARDINRFWADINRFRELSTFDTQFTRTNCARPGIHQKKKLSSGESF